MIKNIHETAIIDNGATMGNEHIMAFYSCVQKQYWR